MCHTIALHVFWNIIHQTTRLLECTVIKTTELNMIKSSDGLLISCWVLMMSSILFGVWLTATSTMVPSIAWVTIIRHNKCIIVFYSKFIIRMSEIWARVWDLNFDTLPLSRFAAKGVVDMLFERILFYFTSVYF